MGNHLPACPATFGPTADLVRFEQQLHQAVDEARDIVPIKQQLLNDPGLLHRCYETLAQSFAGGPSSVGLGDAVGTFLARHLRGFQDSR